MLWTVTGVSDNFLIFWAALLGHQYSAVFRNSLFHHPSFLRDVIGSDQHIGMLCAPCFVSGVPLRACKHASSYYVHSPVAGKGMLESIFFFKGSLPEMLKVIQIPIKCWKNLPSSISVRARAHLLLRAKTCSSFVASPIAKIPKGDLGAMPRVTQKQRNWTPKSAVYARARFTHCVPLACTDL